MSVSSEPPGETFRLSMLIYDTRYRSLTIQVVAFILLMLSLSWLVSNTITNLENLGKDFDFGFLGERAGYDINQRLVEYSNDSSHVRAAYVGILNTLLVAFLGCILATVLGVVAGVLRLSKNWIVARLMAVYVEGFRNVPLLLWILLIFAIFSEALPLPRSFRPDAETGLAESSMALFGSVAISNQGTFIPRPVFAAGSWAFLIALFAAGLFIIAWRRRARERQAATGEIVPTLLPSIGAVLAALVVAYGAVTLHARSQEMTFLASGVSGEVSLAALAEGSRLDYCRIIGSAGSYNGQGVLTEAGVSIRANEYFGPRDAEIAFQSGNCVLYAVPTSEAEAAVARLSDGMRGDAAVGRVTAGFAEGLAIQLDYPEITTRGIPRFEGGIQVRNSLMALWLALSLYTGAFIAEIVRGGILAVSRGQSEAAFALGLRPNRTMNLVILPQALRVIIPPLISNYLNLTKNSSLAIAVGYMDVRSTLGGITINQTGRELEGMLLLGGFYLVASLIISAGMNVYNNSIKLKER